MTLTRVSVTLLLMTAGVSVSATHVTSTPTQHIAVPAYWTPDTSDGALMFDGLAHNAPTVGLVVINGPTSSPPIPFDQATATVIKKLHQAGEMVLGYVDTGYLGQTGHITTRVNPGSTVVADWQAQMIQDSEAWYGLYGSYGIDGIFFDEVVSSCGTANAYLNSYRTVTDYVRTSHSGAYITINPGTISEECYTQIADTISIFENDYSLYQSWTPPAYVVNYPASKFWHIVYNASTQSRMRNVVAKSKRDHAGYVYVTNRQLDATHFPYDMLPNANYWKNELLSVSDCCS